MDTTSIRTFLKVSEKRSFSQAAQELGYAQPTVSTQIAKLEQELGQPLFERMGHRISLTEMGRRFLAYAQQMLLLEEQLEREFKGETTARGTLKLAMADSLCAAFFTEYLLAYRQQCPQVSVVTYTGTTETMFRKLDHNEVDMVYTLDNRISRSDLVVRQERKENIYFCASVSHPLAQRLAAEPGAKLTWEDIKAYPLYLTETGISYRYNLERLLGERGEELRPAIELGNVQTLMRLTSQSDGISFLPEFVLKDGVDSGALVILPVEDISIQVWRQLIYHKGKYLTPAMEAMLALLHSI